MKKLLFFIIPFLFILNVQAFDVDVTDTITSPNSATQGRYSGTEIYNTGTDNIYNVKTRYSGKLSRIRFNLPLPSSLGQCFSTNVSYTVTLNMATSDWRNKFGEVSASAYNHNFALGGVPTFVSMKKIYFNVKLPTSVDYCVDYLFVDIRSTNISTTAFTGESNWQLQSVILTDPTYNNGGSGGGSSTPTPTPYIDLSPIIDSQNQNTEDIISNQNSNTANIIENNNQNTQDIVSGLTDIGQHVLDTSQQLIESQQVCKPISKNNIKTDSYLQTNGVIEDNDWARRNFGITDYLITKNSSFRAINIFDNSSSAFCFYDNDYNLISCRANNSMVENGLISVPSNAFYVRFSIYKVSDVPRVTYCSNGNQAISDSVNDLNDTMKDDNIDDNSSFFSDFETNNHGLTGIITAPLTTIQSLSNNTCTPLSIPIPFTNDNVSLPCMHEVYLDVLGGQLYGTIQAVITGIISYFICLDIFRMVKGFKDPQEDKIEVLDL